MQRAEHAEAAVAEANGRAEALVQERAALQSRLEQAEKAVSEAPAQMPGHELGIQNLQAQMNEKDKQLENLKSTLDEATKLKDNEIKLVSTAFYEIGLELQQRWRAPPQPKSWLGTQRRKLQQERAPFAAK